MAAENPEHPPGLRSDSPPAFPKALSLPRESAFVVRFCETQAASCLGYVEHVVSGLGRRFGSQADLWDFMLRHSAPPPADRC